MAKQEETGVDLGKTIDGHEITGIAVSLNLGSGLNKAVGVSPIEAKAGDVVFIAVKARLVKDRFEYEFDDDDEIVGAKRVLMLTSLGAAFVDEKIVGKAIQSMNDRVAEAEALAKAGQGSFGLITSDDDVDPESDEPLPKQKAERSKFGTLPDQVDEVAKRRNGKAAS